MGAEVLQIVVFRQGIIKLIVDAKAEGGLVSPAASHVLDSVATSSKN